jgi:single-stranded-DNA-specific exonuclease
MIGYHQEETGIIKFSCRSVTGIDIGELIIEALNKNIFLKGGGHAMAGGFSVHIDKINEFDLFLQEKIKIKAEEIYKNRTMYYDIAISIDGLNIKIIEELENILEPYGMKNFKPVFLLQNCQIVMYSVLKEKHLRILIQDAQTKKQLWVVCFNSVNTDLGTYIMSNKGKNIDFLCDISTDVYNSEKKLNIIIKDCILQI